MNKGIKGFIFSVIFFTFVISSFALTGNNAKAANCEWQSGGCNAAENYIYDPGQDDCTGTKPSSSYICCCKGSSSGNVEGDEVVIGTEGGDFLTEVLGKDNIVLKIFKPMNFWEGQAGFWSIFAYIISLAWVIIFLSVIVAVLIGVIKWISSQGDETKVQSAKKWVKNAIVGFATMIVVFLLAGAVTWILGVGSVFDLPQNLSVCGEGANAKALYEYKEEAFEDVEADVDCTCPEDNSGWHCE